MITIFNINTVRNNSVLRFNNTHVINDDSTTDIHDFRADFDKLSHSTFASLNSFSKGDIDNLIGATKLNIEKGRTYTKIN